MSSMVALLLMLACSPGAGPRTPAGTTPLPTSPTHSDAQEICDNGVDDDGDGLLDCEDEECLAHNGCHEQGCFNNADDDGDGLIDCFDEDCWGSGCSAVWLQLTSASAAAYSYGVWNQWPDSPGGCTFINDGYAFATERRFQLRSVRGTIRFMAPGGGATLPSTCSWTANHSSIVAAGNTNAYYDDADLAAPDRHLIEGLAFGPGCPVLTDVPTAAEGAFEILDDLVLVETPSEAQLVLDGQLWATAPIWGAMSWAVDSTTGGASCADWTFYWHREGADMAPVTPGVELSARL